MRSEIDSVARARHRRALASLLLAACACLLAPLSACVQVPDRDPASGCANCPVCLHEADLACVCVKVAADTPRVEWNGRTWYFCSEECKKAFLSDPRRFTPPGADR
jgi:YHS domain-containing protein